MCWACLKRGLIRVFVFEAGDLSPEKNLKREKRTKKKPLRRRACVRGVRSKLSVLLCVSSKLRIPAPFAVWSVWIGLPKYTPCGGEIKHKSPPLQSFYHFRETDQILCDIIVAARNFNKKSPQKWGLFFASWFLVKKGGWPVHEIFYQNSQTWDDVMCYNCERYL